jgi:hypothetical protein
MDNLRNIDGRRIERRSEPRTEVNLGLMVWGVDTDGERFMQEARARDISRSGALLSGLDAELRSGDVVGILYAGRKARYRIVWARYDETSGTTQAAVQRFAPDECPWQELLNEEPVQNPSPPGADASSKSWP